MTLPLLFYFNQPFAFIDSFAYSNWNGGENWKIHSSLLIFFFSFGRFRVESSWKLPCYHILISSIHPTFLPSVQVIIITFVSITTTLSSSSTRRRRLFPKPFTEAAAEEESAAAEESFQWINKRGAKLIQLTFPPPPICPHCRANFWLSRSTRAAVKFNQCDPTTNPNLRWISAEEGQHLTKPSIDHRRLPVHWWLAILFIRATYRRYP